jgi:hypothetical protein
MALNEKKKPLNDERVDTLIDKMNQSKGKQFRLDGNGNVVEHTSPPDAVDEFLQTLGSDNE